MLGLMMLAMGGIPVTAGFVGKVAVFRSAIDAGYLWLVITGVVATVAGLFFYLRVIVLMYMQPAAEPSDTGVRLSVPLGAGIALSVAALVTLVAGLVPWPLLEWLRDALPL
jgi:NADH-quinone oxidoreductase subunit N